MGTLVEAADILDISVRLCIRMGKELDRHGLLGTDDREVLEQIKISTLLLASEGDMMGSSQEGILPC